MLKDFVDNGNNVWAFFENFDEQFKENKKSLKDKEVLFSPGENLFFYIILS
jgi:hypothetical protein